MPTEIRRTVDQSTYNESKSVSEKRQGVQHSREFSSKPESARRKYAILILCIPVLTGAYALLASQDYCDDEYLLSTSTQDTFFEHSTPILAAKKAKKQHAKGKKASSNSSSKTRSDGGGLASADKFLVDPTNTIPSLRISVKPKSSSSSSFVCSRDEDCGGHGKCIASTGACACAVLYEGSRCENAKLFPPGIHPKTLKKKSLNFKGEMVLHQSKMRERDKLKVFLPNKEKDPDKGHRVLSSGDELKRLIAVLPKNDTILNAKVFDKCAVVGSSGIVLSYEHGKDIDSHDMVIRFNSAPTKGFEKHVGSFTTHRITNTQNWAFRERDEKNLLIHLRAKSAIIGLFYNDRSKKSRKKEWIPHLWAFDPNYVEFVAHSLTFMATSGLYGILMAMQRCREVNIYGFHVATKQGALYHYYDVCDVPANPSRDGDEFRFVKALANAGFLNFAEDCILECHESQAVCNRCKEEKNFVQAEMASMKHCKPNRVSEGHNIVPWASRRARARFRRKHPQQH